MENLVMITNNQVGQMNAQKLTAQSWKTQIPNVCVISNFDVCVIFYFEETSEVQEIEPM